MDIDKFEHALTLFDQYNSKDPKQYSLDGNTYPQELFLALRLHQWITKLDPDASEELLLASRCQHIGRWEIPRDSYPDGKAGYLNWRSNLAKYHAEKAALLLTEAGYEAQTIGSVQQIVLKQQIKTNSDVQTMENGLCLVFLEFEYNDFIKKHEGRKSNSYPTKIMVKNV